MTEPRTTEPTATTEPGLRAAVLGSGAWGTTFAMVLADAGCDVTIWGRSQQVCDQIVSEHRNSRNLPGIRLPEPILATTDAAAALDGGPCEVGLESTVVALLDRPRLLRPGSVTRQQIEAVIGPLAEAQADAKRSPGRLARHYSPKAPVRLNADAPQPGEAYLAFGPGEHRWNLSPTGDLREAAARLFAYLRDADRTNPAAIAVMQARMPHAVLAAAD